MNKIISGLHLCDIKQPAKCEYQLVTNYTYCICNGSSLYPEIKNCLYRVTIEMKLVNPR